MFIFHCLTFLLEYKLQGAFFVFLNCYKLSLLNIHYHIGLLWNKKVHLASIQLFIKRAINITLSSNIQAFIGLFIEQLSLEWLFCS